MEDDSQKSKMVILETGFFETLDGKMNGVAMERLHKQICSKDTVESSDEICPDILKVT
jgi:hypothetical protein